MMRGEANERIYGRREDAESINRGIDYHGTCAAPTSPLAHGRPLATPPAEDQWVDHLVASLGPIERMT